MSTVIFIILILAMAVCIARIICNRLEKENDPSNETEGLNFYNEELIKPNDIDYLRDDSSFHKNQEENDMISSPAYSWFTSNIHHDDSSFHKNQEENDMISSPAYSWFISNIHHDDNYNNSNG